MIPYTDNSAHVTDDFCTNRRLQETLAFMKYLGMGARVMDVGEPNFVSKSIAQEYNLEVFNTLPTDFNWAVKTDQKPSRTVWCFEVIEHVMNPLLFLRNIRYQTAGPGSVLYLSTPLHNRFGFFFNDTNHFAEYKEESLLIVLEYSGWCVTDIRKFKSIPFWRGMRDGGGIFRTLLRVLSQETILIRAVYR